MKTKAYVPFISYEKTKMWIELKVYNSEEKYFEYQEVEIYYDASGDKLDFESYSFNFKVNNIKEFSL